MVWRILPAVVVVGLLVAGTTWCANQLIQLLAETVAEPGRHEAVVSLRVLPKAGTPTGTAAYEKHRGTQVRLITSPEILRAALSRPGIAELDALRDEKDKVDWLARHVAVVALPASEVVEIRLRGDDPREAASIVDAVATTYADTVNKQQGAEWLNARSMKYEASVREVRKRLEGFHDLARRSGIRDHEACATQRSLMLNHAVTLHFQLMQLKQDIAETVDDPARRPGAVEASQAALSTRREMLAQQLERTSQEFDMVNREITALDNTHAQLWAERIEISEMWEASRELAMKAQFCGSPPVFVEIIKLASSTGSAEEAKGGAERADDHSR